VEHGSHTRCACALGYSGPACKDHPPKTLSGTVVYGLAGLTVGLLMLVAVLVAVIKRKRANSARFPFVSYG